MIQELNDRLHERRDAYRLLRLFAQRNEAMLRSTLTETFEGFAQKEEDERRPLADTPLADAFICAQEAACIAPRLYLAGPAPDPPAGRTSASV